MKISAAIISLTAAVTFACCGDPRSPGLNAQEKKLSNSEVLVEYRTLSRRPDTVLGIVEGDASQAFAGITDAKLLPGGGIIVADTRNARISIFDQNAHLTKSLGRRGRGPAEFQVLWSVCPISFDSAVANDRLSGRLIVFSVTTGAFRMVQLDVTGDDVDLVGLLNDSAALVVANVVSADKRDRLDLLSVNLRTGESHRLGSARGSSFVSEHSVAGVSRRTVPFSAPTYVTSRPGFGYIVGDPDSGIVRIIREGDSLTFRPRASRTEITADLIRRYLNWKARTTTVWRMSQIAQTEIPQRTPAFDRIMVSSDNEVWLRRYRLPWVEEPSIWDVYSSHGAYCGAVRLLSNRTTVPLSVDLLDVSEDAAIVLVQDSLDVQHVAKYKLSPPERTCGRRF